MKTNELVNRTHANQYKTSFAIPFADIWLLVIGRLSFLNDFHVRYDYKDILSTYSYTLQNIIRKRMRHRFLANANSLCSFE